MKFTKVISRFKPIGQIKVDRGPLVCTILYLLAAVIIPPHVALFIVSFFYFLYMVYTTGSISESLFYCFFPFWLLDVGRIFSFVAVPSGAILNPIYPNGRSLFFTFSPFFILACVTIIISFALVINDFISLRTNKLNIFKKPYMVFFIATYVSFFISSIVTTFFTNLSFLYTLEEYSFFAWTIVTINYFHKASGGRIIKTLTTFFFILFSMLILESGITYIQYARHGVIGLTIEKQTTIPTFGFGIDENTNIFRPIGLSYHANSLANWHIILLSTLVLIWLLIKDNLPKKISNSILILPLLFSVSVIALTVSRSAYFSLIVFVLTLFIFNYKSTKMALKFGLNYFVKFKIPVLIVALFFAYLIVNRTYYSIFTFSNSGGFQTRISQIPDFVKAIQFSPWIGIGNGVYIPVSYYLNPQGPVQFFPENIHNGFLLFLAERGALSLIFYIVGLSFLLREVFKFPKTLKIVTLAGFIASYAMMLFQPFINVFSLNILIVCIILNANTYPKNSER